MRSENTISSLPSVVGEAGCPCVRASMEIFFHRRASWCKCFCTLSNAGRYSCSIQFFHASGKAVLLMSCEVSAKCIHSFASFAPNFSSWAFKKIFHRFHIMVGGSFYMFYLLRIIKVKRRRQLFKLLFCFG